MSTPAVATGIVDCTLDVIETKFSGKFEVSETGCWLWKGTLTKGYGVLSINRRSRYAHRAMWELTGHSFTPGLHLDHLCMVTRCVNPSHLEEVTNRVNVQRALGIGMQNSIKTHCPSGHPYSGDNLIVYGSWRRCRACNRRDTLRFYYRKKQQLEEANE
jgi:hypothetical protein